MIKSISKITELLLGSIVVIAFVYLCFRLFYGGFFEQFPTLETASVEYLTNPTGRCIEGGNRSGTYYSLNIADSTHPKLKAGSYREASECSRLLNILTASKTAKAHHLGDNKLISLFADEIELVSYEHSKTAFNEFKFVQKIFAPITLFIGIIIFHRAIFLRKKNKL